MVDLEAERTVFETPDSPAADSVGSDPPEYVSEYILDESLHPLAARAAFEQSSVDNSLTNFEKLRQTGWRVSRREETRIERLARLRRELEDLRAESPDDGSPIDMLSDLTRMMEITSRRETMLSPGKVASQITLESIEKMSLLEMRLATLESRIGSTTGTALAAQVEIMRAKIGTLTSTTTAIDQRTEHLKSMAEQAIKLQDSDAAIKINDLYHALDSINELSPTVPLILDRLRSLQKVHEDVAESKTKLEGIRAALATRSEEIKDWRSTIDRVERQMQSSGGVMRENLDAVQQLAASLGPRLPGYTGS